MNYSLNTLYHSQGITKQAVYDHDKCVERERALIRRFMPELDEQRDKHSGVGRIRRQWRTTFPVRTVFKNLVEGRFLTARIMSGKVIPPILTQLGRTI